MQRPDQSPKRMGGGAKVALGLVILFALAALIRKPEPSKEIMALRDEATQVAHKPAERIKVPSDSEAAYFLVSLKRRLDGDMEITTRREGKSGTSFSSLQLDCSTGRFASLADADSWEEFSRSLKTGAGRLDPLAYGSVSYWVGLRACGTLSIQKRKPVVEATVAEKASTPRTPLDDKTKQWTWIAVSQDGIRKRLKDPDSAKFSDVFFTTFERMPIVCGRVNSKNGFGGYTGYQRFVAAGEVVGFLEEEAAPGEFSKTWRKMCAHPAN